MKLSVIAAFASAAFVFLGSAKFPAPNATTVSPLLFSQHSYSLWDYIHVREKEYGIPRGLLCALIYHESRGNPNAINRNKGGSSDIGYAQYNIRYLAWYAKAYNYGRSFNPRSKESIAITARELASNYARLGSWGAAIARHNPGMKLYTYRVMGEYFRFCGGQE